MEFEFATAQRIIFGSGKLKELPALLHNMGKRCAFVTGGNAERIHSTFKLLQEAGVNPAALSIREEPTAERVAILAEKARQLDCDFVVALGGGSVLDAGKAIAALITNTRPITDYLEVIGKGEPLTKDPVPCIAIPTTSGTGSEVTRNAVLRSTEHQIKVSLRHPKMLPTIALIDPELTLSMPPELTARTGLDAFTHLLEAFVSSRSNPFTDALCRAGLQKIARALPRAFVRGDKLELREDLALASLIGGLALANAGLGVVHGFAGSMGGQFEVPHGELCAILLTAATEVNIQALQERDPENPVLEKYREVARILANDPLAELDDGLTWIQEVCMNFFIPGLDDYGITSADFPSLIEKAKKSSSMKGNPITLTPQELHNILDESLTPPIVGDATLYL